MNAILSLISGSAFDYRNRIIMDYCDNCRTYIDTDELYRLSNRRLFCKDCIAKVKVNISCNDTGLYIYDIITERQKCIIGAVVDTVNNEHGLTITSKCCKIQSPFCTYIPVPGEVSLMIRLGHDSLSSTIANSHTTHKEFWTQYVPN